MNTFNCNKHLSRAGRYGQEYIRSGAQPVSPANKQVQFGKSARCNRLTWKDPTRSHEIDADLAYPQKWPHLVVRVCAPGSLSAKALCCNACYPCQPGSHHLSCQQMPTSLMKHQCAYNSDRCVPGPHSITPTGKAPLFSPYTAFFSNSPCTCTRMA